MNARLKHLSHQIETTASFVKNLIVYSTLKPKNVNLVLEVLRFPLIKSNVSDFSTSLTSMQTVKRKWLEQLAMESLTSEPMKTNFERKILTRIVMPLNHMER